MLLLISNLLKKIFGIIYLEFLLSLNVVLNKKTAEYSLIDYRKGS